LFFWWDDVATNRGLEDRLLEEEQKHKSIVIQKSVTETDQQVINTGEERLVKRVTEKRR